MATPSRSLALALSSLHRQPASELYDTTATLFYSDGSSRLSAFSQSHAPIYLANLSDTHHILCVLIVPQVTCSPSLPSGFLIAPFH